MRDTLELAGRQAAGRRIDNVLVEMGLVNEEDALKALADALGLTFVELQGLEIDRERAGPVPDLRGLPSHDPPLGTPERKSADRHQRPV